ncbi:hypothetical protein QE152_g34045 [Popillia japonica]|uniref:Uncharacterized protein n=1 Tax=Popillia japonica TaxID=7064 RepID=A0AAW1IVB3_POPJA
MKKSITFMSKKFDELQRENKEIKKMLKDNEKENTNLKDRIRHLEITIDETERKKIENNIIINGIEKQDKQENTKEVVNKLMKKIYVNVEDGIHTCYRKDVHKENSPIIVELAIAKMCIRRIAQS